jgi:Zn-dependent protease
MFYEPPPSQGDLHFRVFGFPVRVSPMFWLMTVVLGLNSRGPTPPVQLVIWVVVVFVSILIHELGHAFAQRRFGGHPWITLYGMGGLASCDDCDRRPSSQVIISLAGPAAGFSVALAVMVILRLAGFDVGVQAGHDLEALRGRGPLLPIFLPLATLYFEYPGTMYAAYLVYALLWANILWGLVNLLPIYPLDGGRVSRELLTLRDASAGIVLSLRLSLVTATAMALFAAIRWQSFFTAVMFGYIAFMNYQTLQRYHHSRW